MPQEIKYIIFVPGILGSKLYLNDDGQQEQIWPPTIFDLLLSRYENNRFNDLRNPNLVPGEPISQISCLDFYESIQNTLRYIAQSIEAEFIPFGYDWRKSITDTAQLLSSQIESVLNQEDGEVILVAHSMGGLVCRYLLESGNFSPELCSKISRFIGLAVPNLGSPLALVRATGSKGCVGLSGSAIASLSSDNRYPSLYQLLPPPSQSILWSLNRSNNIQPINHYENNIVNALNLSTENIQVSRDTWARLDVSRKPECVKYIFLSGTGHNTVTRINFYSNTNRIESIEVNAGDGTVPLWSSNMSQFPNTVAYGSHDKFLHNKAIKNFLYQLFGVYPPAIPYSANNMPIVNISTQLNTYFPGDEIDIIVLPLVPASQIKGVAQLERGNLLKNQSQEDVEFEPYSAEVSVSYEGPEIALARLKMKAPETEGIYRILFTGTHTTNPGEETWFSIVPTHILHQYK